MTSPYRGQDPETPPGAEAALLEFSEALEAARQALKAARDAEVTAKDTFRAAKRKALLSPECPKAAGPNRTCTVAERDAWVDDQVANEEFEYELAKTARVEASEHLRTLSTQGSLAQTLSKSVAESYRGTGGHGW